MAIAQFLRVGYVLDISIPIENQLINTRLIVIEEGFIVGILAFNYLVLKVFFLLIKRNQAVHQQAHQQWMEQFYLRHYHSLLMVFYCVRVFPWHYSLLLFSIIRDICEYAIPPHLPEATAQQVPFIFEWLGVLLGIQVYRPIKRRKLLESIMQGVTFTVVIGCVVSAGIGNKLMFVLESPQLWIENGWQRLLGSEYCEWSVRRFSRC